MSLLTVCFCLFVCRRKLVVKCWVFKPRPLKLLQVLVWILQRIELSTVWTLTEKNIFDAFFFSLQVSEGSQTVWRCGLWSHDLNNWSLVFFIVFQPYPQRDIISVTFKKNYNDKVNVASFLFICWTVWMNGRFVVAVTLGCVSSANQLHLHRKMVADGQGLRKEVKTSLNCQIKTLKSSG